MWREPKATYIYALIDPKNNQAKYIGQTSWAIKHRFAQHLKSSQNSEKKAWIDSLLSEGYMPEMIVIDICRYNAWPKQEAFWISYFRFMGAELFNKEMRGLRLARSRCQRFHDVIPEYENEDCLQEG